MLPRRYFGRTSGNTTQTALIVVCRPALLVYPMPVSLRVNADKGSPAGRTNFPLVEEIKTPAGRLAGPARPVFFAGNLDRIRIIPRKCRGKQASPSPCYST